METIRLTHLFRGINSQTGIKLNVDRFLFLFFFFLIRIDSRLWSVALRVDGEFDGNNIGFD